MTDELSTPTKLDLSRFGKKKDIFKFLCNEENPEHCTDSFNFRYVEILNVMSAFQGLSYTTVAIDSTGLTLI